jgi:hypothetical protein
MFVSFATCTRTPCKIESALTIQTADCRLQIGSAWVHLLKFLAIHHYCSPSCSKTGLWYPTNPAVVVSHDASGDYPRLCFLLQLLIINLSTATWHTIRFPTICIGTLRSSQGHGLARVLAMHRSSTHVTYPIVARRAARSR